MQPSAACRSAAGASTSTALWSVIRRGRQRRHRRGKRAPVAVMSHIPAPELLTAPVAASAVAPAVAAPASLAHLPALAACTPAYQLAGLYELVDSMNELVGQQLASLSPATFALVFGAGLLTSLSPCTLSVLPLTIGYIGGYGSDSLGPATSGSGSSSGGGDGGSGITATASRGGGSSLALRAGAFSAGLATTLAGLGVASSLAGSAYGQIGGGLPIAVACVAILMGLNLLEVLPLRLPSLDLDVRGLPALRSLPPPARAGAEAYLAGLTFALAASPCSTPVLASLLAWVSTSRDPVAGGGLLLAYSAGYVAPLLGAALGAGALARLLALRRWSGWVTPACGVLLLAGGTYALLSRIVP